jgi:photosystem II stability/assembly factor-like uncharacterized protein
MRCRGVESGKRGWLQRSAEPRSGRGLRDRREPIPAARLGVIALLALAGIATAAVDPATLPAEPAHLATRNLLLDIARAGKRLVAVGERGHVLLSDDEGASWVQAEAVPTQNLLTGVCFADEKRGIAVGHDMLVLVTQDAGRTWKRQVYEPKALLPFLDVWCAANGRAIAVGAYGQYWVSADFGSTWAGQAFEPKPLAGAKPAAEAGDELEESELGDPHLNRIAAASPMRLYIAAEAGHLYRSDDAGASWMELPSPYEGSFFGMTPLAGESVLAYGLRGNLFRSDDAGASWRRLETGTVAMLNDAVQLPGGGVAVVGLSGVVLVSRNGERFELSQQSDRKGLSAAVALSSGSIATVGEAGVKVIPLTSGTTASSAAALALPRVRHEQP